MRETRFDAVRCIVRERQRDRPGRRDRAVVGKPRTDLGQFINEFRCRRCNALHVAAVPCVQDATRHLVAGLIAIGGHLGPFAEHLLGHLEELVHDRCRSFLFREFEAFLPAGDRQFAGNALGELDGLRIAVLHPQHRDRRAEAQEAHAVAALALDFVTLLRQRQAIDLDDVVEHPRESLDDLAEVVPVECSVLSERIDDEARQVHRAQEAGTVRRQRLLATGINTNPGSAKS